MKKLTTLLLSIVLLTSTFTKAQEGYQPAKENLENREWFQDAKFGLFVHWGIYSIMAGGGDYGIAEWIMHSKKIPVSQYELLAGFFNPIEFDPYEWVSLVKEAGMKYITITTKHHDGFAMFDSEKFDYNIVDATPYGKDIMRELKDACDEHGIKLFFYYSQLDWHHPDYYPRGGTGKFAGRPDEGDWDKYIDYMDAQLAELLTNYGDVAGIWFDGMWDKNDADWRLSETYALIHELQPGALIGSNHHEMPFPGEDFQMFERDLPGQNTIGYNKAEISTLPLEMCETMNGSWGFNIKDDNFKTTEQLLHLLIKAAGKNSNMLLNTGPMPNGKIQPANVQTLKEIGKWMDQYGETIYETRGGPIEGDWGSTTVKDNLTYIHILNKDAAESIEFPLQGKKVTGLRTFNTGSKIKYKKSGDQITIDIPDFEQTIDFVLVLETK